MLQFHVEHCCIESNPGGCSNSYTGYYTLQAPKVRRYIHLFVASELAMHGLSPTLRGLFLRALM